MLTYSLALSNIHSPRQHSAHLSLRGTKHKLGTYTLHKFLKAGVLFCCKRHRQRIAILPRSGQSNGCWDYDL
jgi:hypothetical protein